MNQTSKCGSCEWTVAKCSLPLVKSGFCAVKLASLFFFFFLWGKLGLIFTRSRIYWSRWVCAMESEGFISFSPAIPCGSVARKTRFLECFQIFTKSFSCNRAKDSVTLVRYESWSAGQTGDKEEGWQGGCQAPLDPLYCLHIHLQNSAELSRSLQKHPDTSKGCFQITCISS